jgi:hypothetical protein
MIGVNPDGVDEKVRPLLPAYMTMGQAGMGGMGEHMVHMGVPRNSIPMVGGPGPFAYIDMGGMFTILKVREQVSGYDDPGWYEHPAGTVADAASADDLRRDEVDVNLVVAPVAPHGGHDAHGRHGAAAAPPRTTMPATTTTRATKYTCPMHPEVVSDRPGTCPKCSMDLVPKT